MVWISSRSLSSTPEGGWVATGMKGAQGLLGISEMEKGTCLAYRCLEEGKEALDEERASSAQMKMIMMKIMMMMTVFVRGGQTRPLPP